MPSHHTPPSSVSATFVKTVSFKMVCMATGLLSIEVPGATPKKPFSGLIARKSPYWSNLVDKVKSSYKLALHVQVPLLRPDTYDEPWPLATDYPIGSESN